MNHSSINNSFKASHLSLSELFKVFLKIGLLSFGGPAAQISLMHRILVDENSWLSEKEYLNALSFCMLLPGPEAMQLATYTGWKLKGTMGGLIAGLLFVLPGALIILSLAIVYGLFGNVPMITSLFIGVKATVFIIVIQALIQVSKRSLKIKEHWLIAFLAFIALFFFTIPYPLVILSAAIYGFFLSTKTPSNQKQLKAKPISIDTFVSIAVWLAIWFIPIGLLMQFSNQSILVELGIFFSKLAIVTFGGAYAVLSYMAQDVVNQFGWLNAKEMIDALGLAETTPGPLILVTEFVGFLSAYREGGFWLGIYGAIITLWVTFIPCFLWIFAFAPYIDWISDQPKLNGALSGISAAVIGVILNLSLWFGLHILFDSVTSNNVGILTLWIPDISSINWLVCLLSIASAIALIGLQWSVLRVIGLSVLFGWLISFI